MQTIGINQIYTKLKTKEDIINYFREHGKYDLLLLNLIGFYYPEYSCFNNKILLDILSGNKKVINYI